MNGGPTMSTIDWEPSRRRVGDSGYTRFASSLLSEEAVNEYLGRTIVGHA